MSDHDDATIGIILTRRQAMLAAARAGLVLGGATLLGRPVARAAPAAKPASLVAAPQMTEGPFFVDERLNRSDLTTGTERAAVVSGSPLLLTVAVYKLTGTSAVPLPGATVDVWHADAHGVYSDEDGEMNSEPTGGQRWLRGYQVTDATGRVGFRTIYPGWYDGRAPHVHFKVRQFTTGATTRPAGVTAEFTSQWFFPENLSDAVYAKAPYAGRGRRATTNRTDGIYGERLTDGTAAGAQMTLALKPADNGGHAAAFTLYLTEQSLHAGPHDGGGPGGGPPPNDMPW